MQRTVFVSGHLDLTDQEFTEYYIPELRRMALAGCKFVVGDARGCDTFVQTWFAQEYAHDDSILTVFHMFDAPRTAPLGFVRNRYRHIGGFKSDNERDTAMTAASTEDLAWVRPGREKSGTAKNLKRRAAKQ